MEQQALCTRDIRNYERSMSGHLRFTKGQTYDIKKHTDSPMYTVIDNDGEKSKFHPGVFDRCFKPIAVQQKTPLYH